ncbi:hypothetical protein HF086_004334 [Spodoptera exigua]|uniref:DDE Tnp4 domain-containing protein n=1 Tax=Spodoptera exigua TaxID=7107 RepID=A0A922MN25_SPOEX|nr:hypothetical protein HF086_004334 [Spodoptera exigua]
MEGMQIRLFSKKVLFTKGDEAFSLQENLLRPYGGKNLPEQKRVFNYRLSRARRFIECTFGIFANKWRIFHRPLNVDVEFAVDIIKAACVLHNYVKQRDGHKFEDTFESLPNSIIETTQNVRRGGPMLTTVREEFANYFGKGIGKKSIGKENKVDEKVKENEEERHVEKNLEYGIDVFSKEKNMTTREDFKEKDRGGELLLKKESKEIEYETQEENFALKNNYQVNDSVLVRYLIMKKMEVLCGVHTKNNKK